MQKLLDFKVGKTLAWLLLPIILIQIILPLRPLALFLIEDLGIPFSFLLALEGITIPVSLLLLYLLIIQMLKWNKKIQKPFIYGYSAMLALNLTLVIIVALTKQDIFYAPFINFIGFFQNTAWITFPLIYLYTDWGFGAGVIIALYFTAVIFAPFVAGVIFSLIALLKQKSLRTTLFLIACLAVLTTYAAMIYQAAAEHGVFDKKIEESTTITTINASKTSPEELFYEASETKEGLINRRVDELGIIFQYDSSLGAIEEKWHKGNLYLTDLEFVKPSGEANADLKISNKGSLDGNYYFTTCQDWEATGYIDENYIVTDCQTIDINGLEANYYTLKESPSVKAPLELKEFREAQFQTKLGTWYIVATNPDYYDDLESILSSIKTNFEPHQISPPLSSSFSYSDCGELEDIQDQDYYTKFDQAIDKFIVEEVYPAHIDVSKEGDPETLRSTNFIRSVCYNQGSVIALIYYDFQMMGGYSYLVKYNANLNKLFPANMDLIRSAADYFTLTEIINRQHKQNIDLAGTMAEGQLTEFSASYDYANNIVYPKKICRFTDESQKECEEFVVNQD